MTDDTSASHAVEPDRGLDGGRRALAAASLAILAAWLLWPVLFAQHLEGYTANLQAIAIMANAGTPMRQDLLMPLVTEFIYFTRGGLIAILQLIYHVSGNLGDGAFRALMIVSLICVYGFAIAAARRLTRVPPWAAATALLLVPGFSESAFYFNDNMPSAAFALAALAIVAAGKSRPGYAAAGGLLAYAMLIRLDAVLLAPAMVGVAIMRGDRLVASAAAAALGVAVVLLSANWLLWLSPIDALLAARGFFPSNTMRIRLGTAMLFFALPGLVVLAAGTLDRVRFWSRHGRPIGPALFLAAYPLAIMAVGLAIATEVRYVYPLLAPFVAFYGGYGVVLLARGMRARDPALGAVAALTLVAMVVPPTVIVREGPHSPTGRLWMPIFWFRWHHLVADNLARVDAVVDLSEHTPATLVINTHFNDDFFLKERLIAAGFSVEDPRTLGPQCRGFSFYRRGSSMLAQIRTENQYGLVKANPTRLRAVLIANALGCSRLHRFDREVLTVYGADTRGMFGDHLDARLFYPILPRIPPETQLSDAFSGTSIFRSDPWAPQPVGPGMLPRSLQGRLFAYTLSARELGLLEASARRFAARPPRNRRDPPVGIDDVQATYRARCSSPLDHRLYASRCL